MEQNFKKHKINLFHSAIPPGYPDKKIHPNTLKNIKNWVYLNNDLEIKQQIFGYDECCDLIKTHFDDELLSYFLLQPHGHFKSDIWRLCALYTFGGAYADIDQELLDRFSNFFNLNNHDFCGVTNMEQSNLSNGFLFAKKRKNNIIEKNIELIYEIYFKILKKNISLLNDVKIVGGCYIMGKVIAELADCNKIPIGEKILHNNNCKFLYEKGNKLLKNKQDFWNSFAVYDQDRKVMNSRYELYYKDRHDIQNFINF